MQLRIVDRNLTQLDSTVITPTSEDSEFLAENIRKEIRSKVWRSSGFYVITAASNDKLNFKVGGGELTATLTPGEYSRSELSDEIETQLNAASAGTYTATFSTSTGKWSLAKSAGTFQLLCNTGSNVATSVWSTIGFDTGADRTGSLTYTADLIAIHSYERVIFDLGSSESVDTFALVFDAMNGMNLSEDAAIRIQANATNIWSSPSFDQAVTLDFDYEMALEIFAVQTKRYWSVKITDPQNADFFVELGKVILGQATQVSLLPSNDFQFSLEDQSKYTETDYGHRYGDVKPLRAKLSLGYQALPYADIQTIEAIFRRLGRGIPLFVAFDPTEDFYDKHHFALYCFFDGDQSVKHVVNGNFQQSFSFLEAM